MRKLILFITLLAPVAHGQIFKCTDADGRVTFSNVSCPTPGGQTESVNVQTNSMGTFASPEQIDQHQQDLRNPSARQRTKVTVVRDSTTGGELDQIVNRRLDEREKRVNQALSENPRKVTVVNDSGRESQWDRARRLRQDEAALGIGTKQTPPPASSVPPIEINDREVPYSTRQDPLDRRIEQVRNKVNDPRPQDGSTAACSDSRPSRGIVRVGRKEIWPGMRQAEVRRLIGSPDSVNSVIVGREQWVYRNAEGDSLFVYMNGACVSSIQ